VRWKTGEKWKRWSKTFFFDAKISRASVLPTFAGVCGAGNSNSNTEASVGEIEILKLRGIASVHAMLLGEN
jgi:hypothetical protein